MEQFAPKSLQTWFSSKLVTRELLCVLNIILKIPCVFYFLQVFEVGFACEPG